MKLPAELAADIERLASIRIASVQAAGGGSINQACILTAESGARLFLKFNPESAAGFFAVEALNLRELARSQTVSAAEVIAESAELDQRQSSVPFLLLAFIEPGQRSESAEAALGRDLAALHSVIVPQWGFVVDNIIGSLPQRNTLKKNWPNWGEFFFEERLMFQAAIGVQNGWADLNIQRALDRRRAEWIDLLNSGAQGPALIHGDLWGGNVVWSRNGAVLIDPACYWGSGEADLAMTQLFGGYGPAFYRQYRSAIGELKFRGFDKRATVLNLYHLMNHANMFGGGYIDQVKAFIGE